MGDSSKLPAVRESSMQPTKGGDSKKPAKGEDFQNTPKVGEKNKVPAMGELFRAPAMGKDARTLLTREVPRYLQRGQSCTSKESVQMMRFQEWDPGNEIYTQGSTQGLHVQ